MTKFNIHADWRAHVTVQDLQRRLLNLGLASRAVSIPLVVICIICEEIIAVGTMARLLLKLGLVIILHRVQIAPRVRVRHVEEDAHDTNQPNDIFCPVARRALKALSDGEELALVRDLRGRQRPLTVLLHLLLRRRKREREQRREPAQHFFAGCVYRHVSPIKGEATHVRFRKLGPRSRPPTRRTIKRMAAAVTALLVGSATAFYAQGPAHPPAAGVRRASRCVACTPAGPLAEDVWSTYGSVRVQGDTLKTWDIGAVTTERVQLSLKSDGRPIDANVELWHTPAYIPTKFKIYTEDGRLRPVYAVIETPKHPKTVALYNTGCIDFPIEANVAKTGLGKAYESLSGETPQLVQGGMITSFAFGPEVKSIQILLKTVEKNMKAKIELTQGPNQVKQVIELYASSGYKNPFYAVIATPGSNSALRVINQNNVEFPFDAYVLPYETEEVSSVTMGPGDGFM